MKKKNNVWGKMAILAAICWLAIGLFVLLTVGCDHKTVVNDHSTVSTPSIEVTPPPTVEAESVYFPKSDWDEALKIAILESKLITSTPADADAFNMKPKEWTHWANIFSMIAFYESKFDPKTSYTEGFDDATGAPVVSRGLFQLSLESGRGYGCPFTTVDDVHDPVKNIQCAVKILERWVIRDNRIAGKKTFGGYLGGARYWAVLRGNRDYTLESLKAIQKANL